jgi:hypothetical protein
VTPLKSMRHDRSHSTIRPSKVAFPSGSEHILATGSGFQLRTGHPPNGHLFGIGKRRPYALNRVRVLAHEAHRVSIEKLTKFDFPDRTDGWGGLHSFLLRSQSDSEFLECGDHPSALRQLSNPEVVTVTSVFPPRSWKSICVWFV